MLLVEVIFVVYLSFTCILSPPPSYFYVGYLWLVPTFFVQKRQVTYVIILVALIIGTHYITNFIEGYFLYDPVADAQFRAAMKMVTGKDEGPRIPGAFGFFNHFLSSLLLSGFAIGLGVMETLKQNEKKQKELEKRKAEFGTGIPEKPG